MTNPAEFWAALRAAGAFFVVGSACVILGTGRITSVLPVAGACVIVIAIGAIAAL